MLKVYLELFVIPVDHTDPVSLGVRQVAGQVAPHPGPEEGRDPPGGREMVLVDVVQHLVVQRDEVLYLRLRHSVLGLKIRFELFTNCFSSLQCIFATDSLVHSKYVK